MDRKMTLTNGSSTGGNQGINPGSGFVGFDAANLSASANMQILLQTNNDLILSIYKTIVESSQETNRKIEALRDDIRDIKLNQQRNDRTLQEEANMWRAHTEQLLNGQGNRHLQDVSRLQDMLMKMMVGFRTAPVAQTQQVSAPIGQTQQISTPIAQTQQASTPTSQPQHVLIAPQLPKATGGFFGTTITTATVSPAITSVAPMVTAVAPIVTSAAPTFVLTTTTPTATVPTTTVSTTVPTVTTAVSTITTTTSTTFGTTTTVPFGGSLFGGGSNAGTNTFANLAAKAQAKGGQAGTGFLSGEVTKSEGSGTKTTLFGASPFGGTNSTVASASDFKFFTPQTKSDSRAADESDKEDETAEDYTPDVHYEPVVPLPPEVEVVSGEEGEEVTFVARCKLYRYDRQTKENKERGLGDIKILFNPSTKKYRCVMRREKVFKICANFPIVHDLTLHKREQMPTVLTWACKDFSEETTTGLDETFTARFKDPNIAEDFRLKMTEAKEAMN